jgi:7-keto-8-aminopelargonate synthetase-like enzyme
VAPDVAAILRYSSHGTLFSAPLTPPDAGASLAAIDIMETEPERVERVRANARLFRAALARYGLDTMGSETAIVPIRIGSRSGTLDAAAALLERGVFVNPVVYPGIPRGRERLRCFVSAAHNPADLEYAAEAAGEIVPPLQRRRQ